MEEKPTSFYPTIKHRFEVFSSKLIKEKITPWLFMVDSGVKIEKADGSFINFKGVGFEGTPRDIFWGNFIEPFLKNELVSIMEDIKSEVFKFNLPLKEVDKALKETVALYDEVIKKVYEQMADVDQRLRGKGNPQSVEKVDVSEKIDRMKVFINENAQSVSNRIKFSKQNLKASENFKLASFAISIVAMVISVASIISSNNWQKEQIPLLQKQIDYLQKIYEKTENVNK